MSQKEITFVLRQKEVKKMLKYNQLIGIQAFIALHNRVKYGIFGAFDDELISQISLDKLDFYLVEKDFLEDSDFDKWEMEAYSEKRPDNFEVITNHNVKYSEWNDQILQGFLTGCSWIDIDWKQYIKEIKKDGSIISLD